MRGRRYMRCRALGLTSILFVFGFLKAYPQTRPQLVVQSGHAGSINSIALSKDGRFLATASGDSTIKLWEVQSGREIKTFVGHRREVRSVRFGSDGAKLITSSADGTARLWDLLSGDELMVFRGHRGFVWSADLIPSSRQVISVGSDSSIRIWDPSTGKELKKLEGHSGPVSCLALTADGRSAFTGSWDRSLRMWDISTGRLARLFSGHSGKVLSVSLSHDEKYLASSSDDGRIKIWNVSTGEAVKTLEGHRQRVGSVSFSPDDRLLASGSNDGTLKIWEVETGRQMSSIDNSGGWDVTVVAFDTSWQSVFFAAGVGRAKRVDLTTMKITQEFAGISTRVVEFDLSRNGPIFAVRDENTLHLWDLLRGREVSAIPQDSVPLIVSVGRVEKTRFRLSSEGNLVATATGADLIIWDVSTGKVFRKFYGHKALIMDYVFSRDGAILASASEDKSIILWRLENGEIAKTFVGHKARVNRVVLSNDNKRLVSGDNDGIIKIWDVLSGEAIYTLEGDKGSVNELVLSSNSDILLSSRLYSYVSTDVRIYDMKSGTELLPSIHSWNFMTRLVGMSNDGKYLARVHGRGVSVFDIRDNKEVTTKEGKLVYWVDFTPDSRNLVYFELEYIGGRPSRSTGKLFEIPSGKEIKTPRTIEATAMIFGNNGRTVISTLSDDSFGFLDQSYDQQINLICLGPSGWVAVTPEGRFDGSEEGMKRLHYVQGLDVLPLESFFEEFHEPNLLSRVLSGDHPNATPTLDFSKSLKLPPKVRFLSPSDGQAIHSDEIDVEVEAVDQGGGIDEIRIYQNDKLISEQIRGIQPTISPSNQIVKSTKVMLSPGKNTFRVVALSADRIESTPAMTNVTFLQENRRSSLFLFTIGISEYMNPKLRLGYARVDAESFLSASKSGGRDLFDKIVNYDLFDTSATKTAIESTLKSIAGRARPEDAFVFYYAGHGTMGQAIDSTKQDFFFVPYDVTQLYGKEQMLLSKGLSSATFRDFCRQIRAQKQLIIIDACEAGKATEAFASRGAFDQKAIAQLARSAGIVILAATDVDQSAMEFSELKHGVFTYALLKGLEGYADGSPKDGKITARELSAYIDDQVPELTKKYRGSPQYPVVCIRGQDFPIVLK